MLILNSVKSPSGGTIFQLIPCFTKKCLKTYAGNYEESDMYSTLKKHSGEMTFQIMYWFTKLEVFENLGLNVKQVCYMLNSLN